MKENIFYTMFGIVMVILIIFGVLVWVGMLIAYVMDDYSKNPNLLFIDIPTIILVHWYGYMTFKHTHI